MLVGSVSRNASILAGAWTLSCVGGYNHATAAAMLPLAFAAEAVTVRAFVRRWPEDVHTGAAIRARE